MSLTIKLIFDKNKNVVKPIDKGLISIRCTIDRKPRYISTGIKVIPKHWDDNNQRITKYNKDWVSINLILQGKISKIEKYYYSCLEDGRQPTFDEIKSLFKSKKEVFEFSGLVNFIKHDLKTRVDIVKSTKESHETKLKPFFDFIDEIPFNEVNLKLIEDYERFLIEKTSNGVNSRWACHKVLKSYLKRALKHGFIESDKLPYDSFKVKKEETERERLTQEELKLFESYQPNDVYEELTYNKFLFSCYTGIRFIDIHHLNRSNFVFNDENEVFLTFKMVKVGATIRNMPLHKLFEGRSIKILKKYYSLDSQNIFEARTEQTTNRIIKRICKELGINKHITFHSSRHTFGSILAEKTNDPILIKNLMGHKKIDTSMIYIKLSNKGVSDKLNKIEW